MPDHAYPAPLLVAPALSQDAGGAAAADVRTAEDADAPAAAEADLQRRLRQALRPLCIVVALSALLWGSALWWGGAGAVVQALARIGVAPVAGGLLVVTASLLLRAWRWQRILRVAGHALPWALQLRVYIAGLALSASPGKLGELTRSLLLRPHGVPLARSVAAFFTDRLADVLGVAALGAAAGLALGQRQPLLEALAVLGGVASLLAAAVWPRWAARWRGHAPTGWRRWGRDAATAWAEGWRGAAPGLYVAVAALAYGAQALVFSAFVQQLAPGVALLDCLAIFTNAILLGAASGVPGGLGATDLALVWQLQQRGVAADAALAATLALRACTLAWAWLLGLAALLSFVRRKRGAA